MKKVNWNTIPLEIVRESLRMRILEENKQLRQLSNLSENRARTRKAKETDLLKRLKLVKQ